MEKYSKYIKYIVTFAVTFLVPALCLAADSLTSSSSISTALEKMTFTPPTGDMSVAYLSKMFGTVPGVDQLSVGSSILGTIFGVFNAGILGLSGAFLSYTIVKIVTETTMDGSSMVKSATIWTSVRCALSTGLLVPQASGYSLINGIVMWVVIQSIGLADLTWNSAMDYLKKGNTSYSSPTSMVDYSLITYGVVTGRTEVDTTNKATSVGSADVLRSLVCSYSVYNALNSSQSTKNKTLSRKLSDEGSLSNDDQVQYVNSAKLIGEDSEVFSIYKNINDDKSKAYVFPYVKDESKNPLKDYGLNIAANDIPTNLTGICGTISYDAPQKSGEADDVYKERSDRYVTAKRAGLDRMISLLTPTAKQIVDRIKNGKLDPLKYELYTDSSGIKKSLLLAVSSPVDYTLSNQTVNTLDSQSLPALDWPYGSDVILNAAAQYQSMLATAQQGAVTAVATTQQNKFDEAKKKGWIAAGGYYRLLAQVQDTAKNEYDSYRLTGYKAPYQPFSSDTIDNRDSNSVVFMTLFKQATTKGANGKTSLEMIDSQYKDILNKSLAWIYLTYPYSKLQGQSLMPADIDKGVGYRVSEFTEELWTSEAWIYARLVLGGIFLASGLLSPAGIPFLVDVPIDWLKLDVNKVFRVWNAQMNDNPGLDPIIKIQNVGQQMMQSGVDYIDHLKTFFATVAISISAGGAVYEIISWAVSPCGYWGICSGVTGATGGALAFINALTDMSQTIIFMNLPIGLAVLTPMLVNGIIFSIYVPLIPYLLFLFGVISWFISVLVLMAAAPIICFLMMWGNASQDNPLLAREAEQFIMQVIGVFFRPTLMVIGLITGMVLSYIGVDVLNLGFAQIIGDVITKPGDSGTLKLIKQVGVMSIYTFTMVSLINMCFSTIYLLYSEAMRIAGISAPATGLEERQLESVKGSTTQVAESGAGGMKESSSGMKGAHIKGSTTRDRGDKAKEGGAQSGDSQQK